MNNASSMLAIVLLVITGGTLFTLLALGVSNRVLLWMGLRNAVRRPGQAALLLAGLALSTAIITSVFGLPDSFNASAIAYRLSALGNVDESVVGTFTQSQIDSSIAQITQNRNVQAVVAISYYSQGPNIVALRTGLGVHNVDFYAVPPSFDQVYGPLTDASGRTLHFAELGLHDAFMNAALAQSLGVRPGDSIQLSFGNGVTATMRAILAHDVAVTSGTLLQTTPEVILSFARNQQIDPSPANTLCIKNVGAGGMDDVGPGSSRSLSVDRTLKQIFGVLPINTGPAIPVGGAPGDSTTVYALKPEAVEQLLSTNSTSIGQFLGSASALAGSSIGTQLAQLPFIFTLLLVGAGLLLLSLLVMLRAVDRRAEMGMSRALGLQRTHLVQLLLFEGCACGIFAALLGILAGIGVTALEIAMLSHLPALDASINGSTVPGSVFGPEQLEVWVSWKGLLSACCIGVLTTLLIVLITALWISRTTIATAMRDLDDPAPALMSLSALLRSLWTPPLDSAGGRAISETPAGRLSRQGEAVGRLVWGLWIRGPLCVGLGGLLLLFNKTWKGDLVQQLAIAFLLAGSILLLRWGVSTRPNHRFNREYVRRVSWSLIGLAWLIEGLLSNQAFLALFQLATFTGRFSSSSPAPILVSLLLPISGMVLLVMANADGLAWLLSLLIRRMRRVAAINRISLVYPLTFRFRTGVTVAMLSTITFLVVLLLTTNLGAVHEAQAAASTGGFQLETDVFGSQLARENRLSSQFQALETQHALGQDFALVTGLHLLYLPFGLPLSLSLDLAGRPQYPLALNASGVPLVAEDTFLASTTMPLLARAGVYFRSAGLGRCQRSSGLRSPYLHFPGQRASHQQWLHPVSRAPSRK